MPHSKKKKKKAFLNRLQNWGGWGMKTAESCNICSSYLYL